MKKLILTGDSLFGRCSKDAIEQLERVLGDVYDVYNCAAGGWDSNDVLKKSPYLSSLQADVVAVSVGLSDLAPWKQVDIDTFSSNIAKIIDIYSTSKLMFLAPPSVDEVRQRSHYEVIRENEGVIKYSEALSRICTAKNTACIDIGADEDYHIEDGVHLNQAGYEKLFSMIKGAIV